MQLRHSAPLKNRVAALTMFSCYSEEQRIDIRALGVENY